MGDFTARRLRRSTVEKQELESEIFIDIKNNPTKKTQNDRRRKIFKDTVGKKKKGAFIKMQV